jgi:hypothetical protein
MSEYRVIWEIDIEADSAQEAAEQALIIQQNPESEAKHFTVITQVPNDICVDYINLNPGEENG